MSGRRLQHPDLQLARQRPRRHLQRRFRWPGALETSDIIGGITSFGKHAQCLGNGFAYRVDQEELIEWILEIAGSVGEADMISVVPIG